MQIALINASESIVGLHRNPHDLAKSFFLSQPPHLSHTTLLTNTCNNQSNNFENRKIQTQQVTLL